MTRILKVLFLISGLGLGLIVTGVGQAQLTVSDPFFDVKPAGSLRPMGDWQHNFEGKSYGTCFFLLANPVQCVPDPITYPNRFEDPCVEQLVGPDSFNLFPDEYKPFFPVSNEFGTCSGGLFVSQTGQVNVSSNFIDWSVFRTDNSKTPPERTDALVFDFVNSFTGSAPGAAQFNVCETIRNNNQPTFRHTTFDNGLFAFDPLGGEVVLQQIAGNIRLAYYFTEAAGSCRGLDFTLFINGSPMKTGFIQDLALGKYVYFDIGGLDGSPTTIRLEVKDDTTTDSGAGPGVPVCANGAPENVNSHLSGVFISGPACEAPPPPKLQVVKTPDGGVFTQGSQVSFNIVVSNIGGSPATNVQLFDQLPGNGGLVWGSTSITPAVAGRSCTIMSNFLDCDLGTIAVGGPVTVVVTSTSSPDTACQDQPNPRALATADGGLQAQDGGSLTCTPTQPPLTARITITKSPDNATFSVGQQLSFTIVVTSDGQSTATNVELIDPLPTDGGLNWTFDTGGNPGGACNITSNTLKCSFGNMAPNTSFTVLVTTNNSKGAPAEACTDHKITNTATATAGNAEPASDDGDYSCKPGKTFSIGPSSMEGAIKISNGDWVNGGYSFKTNFTGKNITVGAFVSITGKCIGGGPAMDMLTFPLQTKKYDVKAGSDWIPTGDANSVLSWQGAVKVGVDTPLICGGVGKLDASKGAVFTTSITGVPPGGLTTFRFKYRDPAAKGKPNTNCLGLSPISSENANRNKADVCGASWSQTVKDP